MVKKIAKRQGEEVTVEELIKKLDLEIVAGKRGVVRQVEDGFSGDLLSDVMGNAPSGCVWITVQSHQNIVAVALLREMAAIVITGGFSPDTDTIERADQEGIPLLTWSGSAYDLAGKLNNLGIGGEQAG